jgi:hypothetical protein
MGIAGFPKPRSLNKSKKPLGEPENGNGYWE